jgi:hypothetical protein
MTTRLAALGQFGRPATNRFVKLTNLSHLEPSDRHNRRAVNQHTAILQAVRCKPGDPACWLAVAGSLADNGRDDEAAAVRVFYPVLRDSLDRGASLEGTLDIVRRNAARLARRARLLDEESVCRPSVN